MHFQAEEQKKKGKVEREELMKIFTVPQSIGLVFSSFSTMFLGLVFVWFGGNEEYMER